MSRKIIRALGLAFASAAMGAALAAPVTVSAQPFAPRDTPAPASAEIGTGADPNKPVFTRSYMADLDGETPMAARQQDLDRDTPLIKGWAEYHQRWPKASWASFARIQMSNSGMCTRANVIVTDLLSAESALVSAGEAYQVLEDIYEHLPAKVKIATGVMSVAQAVAGGFLCALSLGSYCIAALTNAGGNIVSSWANMSLQLANVRLSVANILVTDVNIYLNRLNVREQFWWVQIALPACAKAGYVSAAEQELAPLPPIDNPFLDHPELLPRDRRHR